jgi:cystathionine beta-synthase
MMAEQGISQMPVIDDGEVVGSLTETVILNRLIQNPDARSQTVREVMGEPFPIVPRSLHLEHLSAYLEQGAGAVLVEPEDGSTYQIITKSDLISALATSGLSIKKGHNGKRDE